MKTETNTLAHARATLQKITDDCATLLASFANISIETRKPPVKRLSPEQKQDINMFLTKPVIPMKISAISKLTGASTATIYAMKADLEGHLVSHGSPAK